MYIHNNASKCMKKLQNNSLYKVGTKYGQFIDSINFKKWLTSKSEELIHRISLQTVMQCHCIPLWCQLSGKDDLSVSAYMDIDFPLMTAEQSVSSLLPISSFLLLE